VLRDELNRLRRRPRSALLALAGGLVGGLLLAALTEEPVPRAETATVVVLRGAAGARPSAPAGARSALTDEHTRSAFQRAAERAVARAAAAGGSAEAAVWAEGWSAPVVAGDASRRMRLWSMSKAVTAVAVFEALARQGRRPSPELEAALAGALVRSENCPQRRVIVGLQELTGGAEGARAAVEDVLRRAGASAAMPAAPAPPEPACHQYLLTHRGGFAEPLAPAYQYGTATWTIRDAVAFAHALGDGRYGAAGEEVLRWLALPKQPSREVAPGELTADPAWGAGRQLAPWRPAYKAGWGGSQSSPPDFFVGQLATLVAGTHSFAIAAAFHPAQQPPSDDPGLGSSVTGIERALHEIALELRRRYGA
jgi:hypothetical protein